MGLYLLAATVCVVPPPNGVAQPSTLGKEGDREHNPQRKDYIIAAEETNTPGYIAKAWAHYKITSKGPPLPWLMYRMS